MRPDARALLRRVIEDPADAGAYHDTAIRLRDLGDPRAALRLLYRTHRIAPHDPGARITVSSVYEHLGEYAQAAAVVGDLHRRVPGLDVAAYRLGTLLFRLGRGDREAWAAMEARVNNVGFRRSTDYPPSYAVWDGQPLPGRALVVYAEGGFGDTIAFSRFLPRAAALCEQVIFISRQPVAALVAAAFGHLGNVLVNPATTAVPVGARILAMSLPHALRDVAPGLEAGAPYLRADPETAAAWMRRFPADGRRRVGVFWRTGDPFRSMPLEALSPLARDDGLALCSLEPAPTEPERRILDGLGIRRFDDLAADAGAFTQTAGLVSGLDAVVTIDSAVVHVAGALGVPTALLLPFHGDWRWRTGAATDWYACVRLCRQPRRGAWAAAVAEAGAFLKPRAARGTGATGS